MLKQTLRGLSFVTLTLLTACSQSSDGGSADALTYYKDVKPVVDAKCTACHTAGGIAPFPLTTFDEVAAQKDGVVAATSSGVMPPWPPDDQCGAYAGDRSLSAAEIDVISGWVADGAPEGDPAQAPPAGAGAAAAGLSRVDLTLALPAPYTPVLSPDEYRCFLLDWPETADTFITGFSVTPGDPAIVHHVLAYVAAPADVATYQAYDDADPGLGYSCFGGPRATGAPSGAPAPIVGAWVPGAVGGDFPASTGITIAAGSKLILQVHYNTLYTPPAPDQSQIALKLDATVDKPAHMLPFTDPSWVRRHTMDIPAGAADVVHSFTFDAGTYAAGVTQGAIDGTSPFTIYSAGLHMHLRGSHATLSLQPTVGDPVCLLRILHWDFHWQGSYTFVDPKPVNPGDSFSIECHWDNSAQNQPAVDGQQLPPTDLNWGEGSTDEMCLGFLYATQ